MKMKFAVIISLLVFAFSAFKVVESSCGCKVAFKPVGCFIDKRDTPAHRTLPELLLTERDITSHVFYGNTINWQDFQNYLPGFICRCAHAAKKKGYKVFGAQYWGECWSGPAENSNYSKYGEGGGCYGEVFQSPCKGQACVGAAKRNFIYELVDQKCDVQFERLGCYRDKHRSFRPLSELMLTDRDTTSKNSSGIPINWGQYDTYLPDLACRCAMAAARKGYNTFGLQYYGECWGGINAARDYFNDGVSDNCIGPCYKKCKNFNNICIGQAKANFVYRITSGTCEIPHQKLGCYLEDKNARALDKLLIDDVHPQGSKFMGIYAEHFNDWDKYLKGLICRCARKVKELKYSTFAIYNGGECWSSANGHHTYNNHGSSTSCFSQNATNANCVGPLCAGATDSMYVYELQD